MFHTGFHFVFLLSALLLGTDWYIQMYWYSWSVCLAAGLTAVCRHRGSLAAAWRSRLCSNGYCVCSCSTVGDWHTLSAWPWWWSARSSKLQNLCNQKASKTVQCAFFLYVYQFSQKYVVVMW